MQTRAMWVGSIGSRWDLADEAKGRKQIREFMKVLAEAGTNMLYPQFRDHDNRVGWLSDLEENWVGWDVFGAFLEEGERYNIKVEPWFCLWGDGQELHPEWHARTRDSRTRSKTTSWMCPARPESHEYFLKLCTEVLDRYDVHGIHLDYIRYMHEPCYCDFHVQDFHAKTGLDIYDILRPENKTIWDQYNCDTITRFVEEVSKEVRKRGKQLSAAVFPPLFPPEKNNYVDPKNGWPEYISRSSTWNSWCGHCRLGESSHCHTCTLEIAIFQDWPDWCRRELLDTVAIMNYQADLTKFKKTTDQSIEWAGKITMLQGMGIYPTLGPDIDGLEEEIRYCLDTGKAGICLFDANKFVSMEPEIRQRLVQAWSR